MDFIIGCGMIVVCTAIQCVVVSGLLRVLYGFKEKHPTHSSTIVVSAILIAVLLVLLAGNFFQAGLWSGLFLAFGEFSDLKTAYYHSLVNFTTLGYGDLVMSADLRIYGALEAAKGVLMLGLTTSVLFSAISAIMRRRWTRLYEKRE